MTTRLLALTLSLSALVAEAGQVYVVRADGNEPRPVTTDPAWSCGSPNWSPDGESIAFDAWPVGSGLRECSVCVVSPDGGEVERLGAGMLPCWSPGGDLILCQEDQPRLQVVVMNRDGSGREALLAEGHSARWLPDGETYTALTRDGLVQHRLTSGKLTLLLKGRNYRFQPGYSYAGASDRFLLVDRTNWSLLVVSKDRANGAWSSEERWVAGRRIGQVSWAPDGRRAVVAIGDPKSDCRLFLVDADANDEPRPFPGLPADWIGCNPRWSPDGERIAFIRMDRLQDADTEDASE